MGKRSLGRGSRPRASASSLAKLHVRVSRAEESSVDQLAERLLEPLQRVLRRSFRRVADDLIATAAEDTILEYVSHPSRFDPTRGVPLSRFLRYAARRNLLNLLQSEARRRVRESQYANEVSRLRTSRPASALESPDYRALRWWVLELARGRAERRALLMWLNGDSRTDRLATALGVQGSLLEQRQAVKRFKDRIVKRVRRYLHSAPYLDVGRQRY